MNKQNYRKDILVVNIPKYVKAKEELRQLHTKLIDGEFYSFYNNKWMPYKEVVEIIGVDKILKTPSQMTKGQNMDGTKNYN